MNSYINYNGSLFQSHLPIVSADSRALKYGDGLFETIRIIEHQIHLSVFHFERLFASMEVLQFQIPHAFTSENLTSQILNLCETNNLSDAKVRLNVFRGNGSLRGLDDLPNYIIQVEETGNKYFSLNEAGLVIDVFSDGKKSCDRFSNIKSNNFLLYSMAASYARKNVLDDCVVLNIHERICESTISNIFLVKNESIYTPSLHEGCISGVMRRYLLEKLYTLGFAVNEGSLTIADVRDADEVFFSNSISGMRWVRQFQDIEYHRSLTTKLFNEVFHNKPLKAI